MIPVNNSSHRSQMPSHRLWAPLGARPAARRDVPRGKAQPHYVPHRRPRSMSRAGWNPLIFLEKRAGLSQMPPGSLESIILVPSQKQGTLSLNIPLPTGVLGVWVSESRDVWAGGCVGWRMEEQR